MPRPMVRLVVALVALVPSALVGCGSTAAAVDAAAADAAALDAPDAAPPSLPTTACSGSLCTDYLGYGGANGDGAWVVVYDSSVPCDSAVVYFHGGMFPTDSSEVSHTRDEPMFGEDSIRAAAGSLGDVMGGAEFGRRGGRIAALGAVNKVGWTDTRGAWATLHDHLSRVMQCGRIVAAGESSGGWAAIEFAATLPAVTGSVVSNAATNFPLLRAIHDDFLAHYDPADPATAEYCTRYVADLTYTCQESSLCTVAEACDVLKYRTGWVAASFSLFADSTSGALPRASDSQFSSSDPYQVELLGVFPAGVDPGAQEGYNRATDLDVYPDCQHRHSLPFKCAEGAATLRDKLVAVLGGQ
ncbi:MAG: hypothetical protein HY906_26305 [Deltaproteobacteria bacterium]|nr:hypothetical protein [Deltaproteobacteria bacterium]